MKRRTFILCTALLLLSNTTGLAQKKKTFCAPAPPSPFKHNGQIVTSFDPARGMRTTLEHPRPIGSAQGELYLKASFVHRDPRRPGMQMIELYFVSAAREQRFSGSQNLTLLCDGKRVPLTSAASYQSRPAGQGMVLETLRVTLSQADLAGVTGARKVTARVGASEFELTNNHLEALRELASLIGNSTPRWRAE